MSATAESVTGPLAMSQTERRRCELYASVPREVFDAYLGSKPGPDGVGPAAPAVTAKDSDDRSLSRAVTCATCGRDVSEGEPVAFFGRFTLLPEAGAARMVMADKHQCAACAGFDAVDKGYRCSCVSCGRPFLRASAGVRRVSAATWIRRVHRAAETGTPPPSAYYVTRHRHRLFCRSWCEWSYYNKRRSEIRELIRTAGRTCAECQAPFEPPRSDARYCSSACRQRAYRRRQSEAAAENSERSENRGAA
jgi:hypothetical protein